MVCCLQSKAQASLEAALTEKAAGLRKGSDSEDEARRALLQGGPPLPNLFDDELGDGRFGVRLDEAL